MHMDRAFCQKNANVPMLTSIFHRNKPEGSRNEKEFNVIYMKYMVSGFNGLVWEEISCFFLGRWFSFQCVYLTLFYYARSLADISRAIMGFYDECAWPAIDRPIWSRLISFSNTRGFFGGNETTGFLFLSC